MAGYIEDRWINKKKDPATGKRERTARYGKGSRYRVAGIPGVRDMSFDTLEDAKAWLRRAGTDSERGEFVDPRDGSITVADYVAHYWKAGVRVRRAWSNASTSAYVCMSFRTSARSR